MREVVRADALDRAYLALDYFDASINRTIAWTVGARNARKALLSALLEPTDTLKKLEAEGDNSSRLALQQELLTLPFGAIWDEFCERQNTPVGVKWIEKAKQYDLLVVPGDGFGCPGYFRICYCVSYEMILKSLPAFQALITKK